MAMLKFGKITLAALMATLLVSTIATAQQSTDWPVFRKDQARTGADKVQDNGPGRANLRWSWPRYSLLPPQIVADDSEVHSPSYAGSFAIKSLPNSLGQAYYGNLDGNTAGVPELQDSAAISPDGYHPSTAASSTVFYHYARVAKVGDNNATTNATVIATWQNATTTQIAARTELNRPARYRIYVWFPSSGTRLQPNTLTLDSSFNTPPNATRAMYVVEYPISINGKTGIISKTIFVDQTKGGQWIQLREENSSGDSLDSLFPYDGATPVKVRLFNLTDNDADVTNMSIVVYDAVKFVPDNGDVVASPVVSSLGTGVNAQQRIIVTRNENVPDPNAPSVTAIDSQGTGAYYTVPDPARSITVGAVYGINYDPVQDVVKQLWRYEVGQISQPQVLDDTGGAGSIETLSGVNPELNFLLNTINGVPVYQGAWPITSATASCYAAFANPSSVDADIAKFRWYPSLTSGTPTPVHIRVHLPDVPATDAVTAQYSLVYSGGTFPFTINQVADPGQSGGRWVDVPGTFNMKSGDYLELKGNATGGFTEKSMDNPAASPGWSVVTGGFNPGNGNYLQTPLTGTADPALWATTDYTIPNMLPVNGGATANYLVDVFVPSMPSGSQRGYQVQYLVTAGGVTTKVYVNQNTDKPEGEWKTLGIFPVANNGTIKVTCTNFDPSISSGTNGDIVELDDSVTASTERDGVWVAPASPEPGAINGTYTQSPATLANDPTTVGSFIWKPTLNPQSGSVGRYTLFVRLPQVTGAVKRASWVEYTINTVNGPEKVHVNQAGNCLVGETATTDATWLRLGTFTLSKTGNPIVMLTNYTADAASAGSVVIADAIRLEQEAAVAITDVVRVRERRVVVADAIEYSAPNSTAGAVTGTPAIGTADVKLSDGTIANKLIVVVPTLGGELYGLDATGDPLTGNTLSYWVVDASVDKSSSVQYSFSSPVFATKGAGGQTMVLVNNFWGRTMAIDTTGNGDYVEGTNRKGTTNLLWAYPKADEPSLGEQIVSSPAVSANRVFITTLYGRVHAIDLTTGEKIWQYPETPTWGGISSTPAIFEDKVIFGTESGHVVALPASGTDVTAPVWEYPSATQTVIPDSFVLSSPAVLELPGGLTTIRGKSKVLYIGDRAGYLWAIDAVGNGDGTTELAWSDATNNQSASRRWNGQIQSSPSFTYITRILNSWTVVFGVMGNGALYGVNALNGGATTASSYVWGYATEGQNVFASAAIANSWMYMGSDDGFLYAFNNKAGFVNGYTPGEDMPGQEITNPDADPNSDACIDWSTMKVEFFSEKEYEAIRQGQNKLGSPNPDFRTPESVENLRLRRPGFEWGDRVFAVVYGLDVTCVKDYSKRPRSVTIGIRGNIENYQISTTFIPYSDPNATPVIDPDTGEVIPNVKLRAYVGFNITPDRNTWWTPGQKLSLFAKPTDGELQVGVDPTKGITEFTIYNPIALNTGSASIGWSTNTPTGSTIPPDCEFALNGNGIGSPLSGGTSVKRVGTVVASAGGDFIQHGTTGMATVRVANRSKMGLVDSAGNVFPAGEPRRLISGLRVIPAKLAYGSSTPFNYLPSEIKPTVPNRSLEYPDIPEQSSIFFLNGSDVTYGTQRVTLPPAKANNTSDVMPGDTRTMLELSGRLNVSVPKYQPENDAYTGMYTVYLDLNSNGRLDTSSSSDYWTNPVPSTKDETYRIFTATAKVPRDAKIDVVDKNVFLGTVAHGFGEQMGNTLPNFTSGGDPRSATWKPIAMRNTGNVNLIGLRFLGLPPMPTGINVWNSGQVNPFFGLYYSPATWMQISSTLDPAWDSVLPARNALKPRPGGSPTFMTINSQPPRLGARIPVGTPQGTYTGFLTVKDDQGLVPVSVGPNDQNEPYGTNVLKANVTVVESRMTNDRSEGTLWQLQNSKQSGDLPANLLPSAIIDNTTLNVAWTSNRGNPLTPSWRLYFGQMGRDATTGQWLPNTSDQWFQVNPLATAGFPDDPSGDLFKQSGDSADTVLADSGQHSGAVLFTYGSKKYCVWYGTAVKVYNSQQFNVHALFMAPIGSDGQPNASAIDRLPFDPMLPMSKPAITVENNRAILMWMSNKGQVMYSMNSDSTLDVTKWSNPARLVTPRGIREIDSARPMTLTVNGNDNIYVMVSGLEQNGDASQAYMLRYNLRGTNLVATGLGSTTETTRLQRVTNSNVWIGRDLSWQQNDIKLFLNGVELVATSSAYDDQSGVMTFATADGGGYLVDLSQGTVTFPYAQPKLTDVVTAQYQARAMRLTVNRDDTAPTIYAGSNTNAIGTVESGGGAMWTLYRKVANTGATQAFFGKRLVVDPKLSVDQSIVDKANAGQIKTTGMLWDNIRETMVPTTGAASESYMSAVQDPKDGKLWLFWSSSRTGATDLFYQTWAPRPPR